MDVGDMFQNKFEILDSEAVGDHFEVGVCTLSKESHEIFTSPISEDTTVFYYRRVLKEGNSGKLHNIVNSNGTTFNVQPETIKHIHSTGVEQLTREQECWHCLILDQGVANIKSRSNVEKSTCFRIYSAPFGNEEDEHIYVCEDCLRKIETALLNYAENNTGKIFAKLL